MKIENLKERWNNDIYQYHIKRLKLNPIFKENKVKDLFLLGIEDLPNFTQQELDLKVKDLISKNKKTTKMKNEKRKTFKRRNRIHQ